MLKVPGRTKETTVLQMPLNYRSAPNHRSHMLAPNHRPVPNRNSRPVPNHTPVPVPNCRPVPATDCMISNLMKQFTNQHHMSPNHMAFNLH